VVSGTINPIYMIALPLAVAFSLGIFDLFGRNVSRIVFILGIVAEFILALLLFNYFVSSPDAHAIEVMIGGFLPPKGINLKVGYIEAIFAFIIHTVFLLGSLYWLYKGAGKVELRGMILYLLLSLGATGLIFTNDIFNLFVFIEITSIASYALVSFYNRYSLEAAFKFLVAGSISSTFLLIGIITLYKHVGNLNLTLINNYLLHTHLTTPLVLSLLFIFASLLIEVEMWPFNGWAIDVYQGASPAIAAVLAGGVSKGFFLVFFKLNGLFVMPQSWHLVVIYTGLATLTVSQFFAWRQSDFRRLLGYSSIAQLGILVTAAGLLNVKGISQSLLIKGVIFLAVSHAFAKSLLFWVTGLIRDDERLTSSVWRKFLSYNPWIKGFAFIAILSLIGVPPFPGFWGKYYLLVAMKDIPRAIFNQVMTVILVASIAEVVYYIKWWRELGHEKVQNHHMVKFTYAPFLSSLILIGTGIYELQKYVFGIFDNGTKLIHYPELYSMLLIAGIFVWLIAYAGPVIQWIFSLITVVAALLLFEPLSSPLLNFFYYLILGGAVIFILGSINAIRGEDKDNPYFYPLFLILTGALTGVAGATSWLTFFINWEIMAWTSFLLLTLSGYSGKKAGFVYSVIGTIGGMSLLAAIVTIYAYLPSGASFAVLFSEAKIVDPAVLIPVTVLMITGFGVKLAMVPLHIWARDSYADSPDGFTPFFSGILSKIGVFGLILFFSIYYRYLDRSTILYILGWLGTIGAFGLTLIAVFQDDAKKLLAYSSVGQVAYIIVGIAIFTPLGWTAALYHTVNHALFKGLLFLAIAGVIARTGTRSLHEMGGLIKKMPFSFFSVLIGIIALAGIPPLSGFGGKWLLYNALLEKKWYLMLSVNMLASVIAFLYLYRLISSIFLGQLKPKFENIKEVPLPLILAESILIVFILIISVFPEYLINPAKIVSTSLLPLGWTLSTQKVVGIVSSFGHWNAFAMMIFAVVLFVIALVMLVISAPKAQKIGQLDIGYSGEVPEDPEELHYSWKFYAHYFKGMSWILKVKAEPVYRWLWENINGTVEVVRRFYTGNIATYAYYITISALIIIYIIVRSG